MLPFFSPFRSAQHVRRARVCVWFPARASDFPIGRTRAEYIGSPRRPRKIASSAFPRLCERAISPLDRKCITRGGADVRPLSVFLSLSPPLRLNPRDITELAFEARIRRWVSARRNSARRSRPIHERVVESGDALRHKAPSMHT